MLGLGPHRWYLRAMTVAIGDRFGHLIVICGEVPRRLLSGRTKSCGCQRAKGRWASRRHGLSRSLAHRSWIAMRYRCRNPKAADWKNYGGRGITVCDRWCSFELFLADMGPRPSVAHSIDRIDNEGNYEPSNCRWADARQQSRNTRTVKLEPHEPEQIRWLRSLGYRYKEIGAFFGIDFSTVGSIIRGESWVTG